MKSRALILGVLFLFPLQGFSANWCTALLGKIGKRISLKTVVVTVPLIAAGGLGAYSPQWEMARNDGYSKNHVNEYIVHPIPIENEAQVVDWLKKSAAQFRIFPEEGIGLLLVASRKDPDFDAKLLQELSKMDFKNLEPIDFYMNPLKGWKTTQDKKRFDALFVEAVMILRRESKELREARDSKELFLELINRSDEYGQEFHSHFWREY